MRPVNLLPEEHRPRRRKGSRPGTAYAVVGVLAVLLGMVTVYVLTANQVSARKADAAEAKRDTERAQAEIARLGPFGNFAQIKEVRLASVKDLAQARFDWERFVRELALVLPHGSWLQEVDAAVTGEDGEGPGASGAAGAAAAGPSATLKGCARRQPDVAKLMVRLRKLHRVKDVELKESTKQSDAGSAGSGAAGGSGGSGGSGTADCGDRYQFEVVTQFDEARPAASGARKVPASLGGGG